MEKSQMDDSVTRVGNWVGTFANSDCILWGKDFFHNVSKDVLHSGDQISFSDEAVDLRIDFEHSSKVGKDPLSSAAEKGGVIDVSRRWFINRTRIHVQKAEHSSDSLVSPFFFFFFPLRSEPFTLLITVEEKERIPGDKVVLKGLRVSDLERYTFDSKLSSGTAERS